MAVNDWFDDYYNDQYYYDSYVYTDEDVKLSFLEGYKAGLRAAN